MIDRETLADILTNEEPDSYIHGERTFRDWMLEYADNVLSHLTPERSLIRKEFADELTRKGVYLFNIHDICRYAEKN